jgi:hypothetical protein
MHKSRPISRHGACNFLKSAYSFISIYCIPTYAWPLKDDNENNFLLPFHYSFRIFISFPPISLTAFQTVLFVCFAVILPTSLLPLLHIKTVPLLLFFQYITSLSLSLLSLAFLPHPFYLSLLSSYSSNGGWLSPEHERYWLLFSIVQSLIKSRYLFLNSGF